MTTRAKRTCLRLHLCALLCAVSALPSLAADWDHIHLQMPEPLAAAEWYVEHFGGELTKSGPFDAVLYGTALVKMREGEGKSGTVGTVVDHIGFSVPDVKAKIEQLAAAGVEIASRARRLEAGDFSFAFVVDPWGTKIELIDDGEPGFHHIHLSTADPAATLEWYADTFGGEVTSFRDLEFIPGIAYGSTWLLVAKARTETVTNAGSTLDHIGFNMTGWESLVAKLKAAGTSFLGEPRDAGDHRIVYIEGPDGTKIELVERVD